MRLPQKPVPTQGRHTAQAPHLTPPDWVLLRRILTASTTAESVRLRAYTVLLAAQGFSLTMVARRIGMSRKYVYKWLRRWEDEGLAGLQDSPAGRRRRHHTQRSTPCNALASP